MWDKVHIFLKIDENKNISDISFEGEWMCNINGLSIYNDRFNEGKKVKRGKRISRRFSSNDKRKS